CTGWTNPTLPAVPCVLCWPTASGCMNGRNSDYTINCRSVTTRKRDSNISRGQHDSLVALLGGQAAVQRVQWIGALVGVQRCAVQHCRLTVYHQQVRLLHPVRFIKSILCGPARTV